jgi:ankyrin repeat protein
MNSHIEVIKYLLSKGAKINAKNANEVTPLHWAVAEGNVDVIDTLINAGGEVNARNANGKTPLRTYSALSFFFFFFFFFFFSLFLGTSD